jgi:hypothetical protein
MQVQVVKATIEQKPVLANLLELYAYDFTEFCDFDIGAAANIVGLLLRELAKNLYFKLLDQAVTVLI